MWGDLSSLWKSSLVSINKKQEQAQGFQISSGKEKKVLGENLYGDQVGTEDGQRAKVVLKNFGWGQIWQIGRSISVREGLSSFQKGCLVSQNKTQGQALGFLDTSRIKKIA